MAKQKKRIAEPWYTEIEFVGNDYPYILNSITHKDLSIPITLINKQTGEIRQKKVTIDQIARRIFESEISTWKDIELENIE